jgi:putative oxidoreductase
MAIVERDVLSAPERVPTFDIIGWVLRLAAAGVFVAVGLSKLRSDPFWVQMFGKIGLGDWFRYLTGALQVGGGLLFLVPRARYVAALLAGGTMAGAIVVHLLVLGTGVAGAIIPFVLLVFIAAVVLRHPA